MPDPEEIDVPVGRADHDGLAKRPEPAVTLGERARAWWRWFGPARVVATVASVVVVGGLGFWLVRAPVPAVEATLPSAGATSLPDVTLAVSSPGSVASADGSNGQDPSRVSVTTTRPSTPATIVVHVAGAVADPGVYELSAEARVDDAIGLAGGPSADADLDAVNLAETLADGQRLYVPIVGSVDHSSMPVLSPTGSQVGSSEPADDRSTLPAGPIDLNRAGGDELEQLPGVGPATAQAIIDDRERNGPFVNVDDLERVPGVGPAKLAALRDLVTV